jgi:hypothetical protein
VRAALSVIAVSAVALKNSAVGSEAGDDRLQPPLLHAAQHHQACQEKADQQAFAQDQRDWNCS